MGVGIVLWSAIPAIKAKYHLGILKEEIFEDEIDPKLTALVTLAEMGEDAFPYIFEWVDTNDNELLTRVWFNRGNGTFLNSNQILPVAEDWSVAVGDLDGDSDIDLIVGGNPAKVFFNSSK